MIAQQAKILKIVEWMKTEASVVLSGERIVQINILPTGEYAEELDSCSFIADDFLSHQQPADFWAEDGRIIFSCYSGIFSFKIGVCPIAMEKIQKQIHRENFIFAKKSSGFSLIAG